MKITRIVARADGQSAFEDQEVTLADKGKFGFMSDLQAAPGIIFREVAADYDSGWHQVPGRLYLVILEGQLGIQTGDGAERRFGPGAVILAEDTAGSGHRTKALAGQGVRSILVTLQ